MLILLVFSTFAIYFRFYVYINICDSEVLNELKRLDFYLHICNFYLVPNFLLCVSSNFNLIELFSSLNFQLYPKAYHSLLLEPNGIAEQVIADILEWLTARV